MTTTYLRKLEKIFIALCLLFIPTQFAMAQADGFRNEVQKGWQECLANGNDVYIAHLTFRDAFTQTSAILSEDVQLLNDAFLGALRLLRTNLPGIKVNEVGRGVSDNDQNATKLATLIADPNLAKTDKVQQIAKDLMDPSLVDMLTMGQTKETATNIDVHLSMVIKKSQVIISQDISLPKQEYLCADLLSPTRKTLCEGADVKLFNVVAEMIENGCPDFHAKLAQKLTQPTPAPGATPAAGGTQAPVPMADVYVSYLSFMEFATKRPLLQNPNEKLIQAAVEQGIQKAQQANPSVKYNEAGHVVENNDANSAKLITLLYNEPTLTSDQKIDRIMQELMTPNQLDVILSGQYQDDGNTVTVKPYIIQKSTKTIVSKTTVALPKQDFFCDDPQNASQKVICAAAAEELAQAVQALLESL